MKPRVSSGRIEAVGARGGFSRTGRWAGGFLCGALIGGTVACGPAGGPRRGGPGLVLPGDLVLEDSRGGAPVRLDDYEGTVRFLNFWATWCDPCRGEIRHFNELVRKYGDRGFQMIGVSMDAEVEDVRAFEREIPLQYPSLMYSDELLDAIGGIYGLPTTVILARDGTVYQRYVGYTSPRRFREDLETLLFQEGDDE